MGEQERSTAPIEAPLQIGGERDSLFSIPIKRQFEFDERVASVFDDMIQRSVPFYWENLQLEIEILKRFLKPGDLVIDLGCSTGNFLLKLGKEIPALRLIGIDNSKPMLERARLKGEALGVEVEWVEGDFFDSQWEGATVVVANYTLQFVRPLKRGELVRQIYRWLTPGGLFFAAEKVIFPEGWFNRVSIDIYYQFKRKMGYSDYEISQKREALENVLIPYTLEENRELLRGAGFAPVETIFQWNNFATFLAFKPSN
ncbi:MAG: carboxy-S-adenosyl-L-methionine synthase CmoA [Campylobacterales bacterium]